MSRMIISEYSEGNKQHAWFEDDGYSAWIYLYDGDMERLLCKCWVYNRITPPSEFELTLFAFNPPPAIVGVTAMEPFPYSSDTFSVDFKWEDGGKLQLLINGEVFCILDGRYKKAYTKYVLKDSDWGNAFLTT